MLNDLSADLSMDEDRVSDGDNVDDARFGLTEDQYNRGRALFGMAKGGEQFIDQAAYVLNKEIRNAEKPTEDANAHDYNKALFYMYGYCEDWYNDEKEQTIMAHSLLKHFEFYNDSKVATKILSK